MKKHIVIISPALANANNGNWQTASRWARMLRLRYRVSVVPASHPLPDGRSPDLIIALHARRSAAALEVLQNQFPEAPSIVVLTGTDLYRDIHIDASAKRSLKFADRLVVLQEAGLRELSPILRGKATVICQSAAALKPVALETRLRMRHFEVCMIGHLRDEKDPLTFMQAAALLANPKIRLTHIGSSAQAPELGREAEKIQRRHPNYRWLGDLPHGLTRQILKRSHLMVIASKMEGGANVIIEALTCGVPVLASDISGNRGMLGKGYAGYFPCGDSAALAKLIERSACDDQYYLRLHSQCQACAPLFAPEREQASLLQLVDNTLRTTIRKEHRS